MADLPQDLLSSAFIIAKCFELTPFGPRWKQYSALKVAIKGSVRPTCGDNIFKSKL